MVPEGHTEAAQRCQRWVDDAAVMPGVSGGRAVVRVGSLSLRAGQEHSDQGQNRNDGQRSLPRHAQLWARAFPRIGSGGGRHALMLRNSARGVKTRGRPRHRGDGHPATRLARRLKRCRRPGAAAATAALLSGHKRAASPFQPPKRLPHQESFRPLLVFLDQNTSCVPVSTPKS